MASKKKYSPRGHWPTRAQLAKEKRERKRAEKAIQNRVDRFLASVEKIAHALLLVGLTKQAEEARRKKWDREDTRMRQRSRRSLRTDKRFTKHIPIQLRSRRGK